MYAHEYRRVEDISLENRERLRQQTRPSIDIHFCIVSISFDPIDVCDSKHRVLRTGAKGNRVWVGECGRARRMIEPEAIAYRALVSFNLLACPFQRDRKTRIVIWLQQIVDSADLERTDREFGVCRGEDDGG